MGVLDRHEVIVVFFGNGVVPVHPTLAGEQPFQIDLHHCCDACELLEVGYLRFAAQDVVDELAVHMRLARQGRDIHAELA